VVIKGGQSVDYKINEVTRNKTTRCTFKFQCLNDDSFPMCSIEDKIKEGIYFIKMFNPMNGCNYCVAFGGSHLCLCPTRSELYEQYKV